MKLLYLCHRVPFPPNKGEKTRAYHQLRHLARRHEIDLLALSDRPQDELVASPLGELCRHLELVSLPRAASLARAAAGLAGRRPLTLRYFHSPRLARRVAELARARRFDLVVACSSSMAPYAGRVPEAARVLDLVDVDSVKWARFAECSRFPRRPVYRLEARRLRAYEATLGRHFDRFLITTARELRELRSLLPEAPADVVPTAIDVEELGALGRREAGSPRLVFLGQMDYLPNVDAVTGLAEGALPGLRRRWPDLELHVVGRSPAPAVRALARRPGVVVTGEVEDVRPHLAAAWVFVAPIRIALGIQSKILEALAAAAPTVVSMEAMGGLAGGGLEPGRDLVVAANGERFAEAVGRLLADAGERRRLSESGRRAVAAAYGWERLGGRLEEILLDTVGAAGSEGPLPRAAEARQGVGRA